MKSISINCFGYIRAMVIMVAFIFAQPALAECVQSDPPADPILAIDANNGCADIQNQSGCTIKDPTSLNPLLSTCRFDDTTTGKWFIVNSAMNMDGSLSWSLDPTSTITGVDTAIIGGGSKGKNNCGYIYKYDVASGSGGDCKAYDTDGTTCISYQNITSLDVCTDGVTDEAPTPPPEPVVALELQYCQTPGSSELGMLDDTGIRCPILYDEFGNCIEDELGNCKQAPVIVCNLEKDKYAWGTVGADVEGGKEQVCCQCGITKTQTACFVSDDPDANAEECAPVLTSDPSQDVVLTFQKDGDDPCYTKYSGGKPYKVCW